MQLFEMVNITANFKRLMDVSDQEKQLLVWDYFEQVRDKFKAKPTDKVRLLVAWAAIETFSKTRPPLQCAKGCSRCCYQQTTISDTEALALVDYCAQHKIPISVDHLREQLDMEIEDYQLDNRSKCVFLSDKGECAVYEVRPLVCRAMAVGAGMDVNNCGPQGKQYVIGDFKIESTIGAYWSSTKSTIDSLPKKLIGLLENEVKPT